MNRAARRAAAAQARRAHGRTGYLHRLLSPQAVAALASMRGKLVHSVIEHDAWCAIYKGGTCCCVPNISLHPEGLNHTVIIDDHGQAKKIAKS